MDPEYIELIELFQELNLKLDFELTAEQIAKIKLDYPEDRREKEIKNLKKQIYNQRKERSEILSSFLTLKYNFDYSLFNKFMKNDNNLVEIDVMERRINEINLDNLDGRLALELEDYYYNYMYHYYKKILEKTWNQDIELKRLILNRIYKLNNLVNKGFNVRDNLELRYIYEFVDRNIYTSESLAKYEDKLRTCFFEDSRQSSKKVEPFFIALPEYSEIFRNRRIKYGLNQGIYASIPLGYYRIEKDINIGDIYQYKGQNIVSTFNGKIYPIERLSRFTTISREIIKSYNYKILGNKITRNNIIKRLEDINSSGDSMKKLLFTIFADYILLFISDLTNILKEKNIGLLLSGGFAYRYYNQSYITEDIDIILGNLIDDKISIKPIENYSNIFKIITDYFYFIKHIDFTKDIILNIIYNFFKDLKRLGINLNSYDNIKQFYTQFKDNNIDLDFNLSSPPHNDKILKLTITLNNINRFAYIDININDKTKAINTFSIINKINPFEIEDMYISNEFNIDNMYLLYKRQIDNTFYPNITIINPIYDTASILNIIDINYILFEKTYLIDKLNNNLLFGIIPLDFPQSKLQDEIIRLLTKFNKLLITNYELNRFYSFNPNQKQIQLFNTFIG